MRTTNRASRKLYPYQQRDADLLLNKLKDKTGYRLLYQLPTGAGKTVIFGELVRHFIEGSSDQALVLTHRTELCRQTSLVLKNAGVSNKIINSETHRIRQSSYRCFVAMVETLKNRIEEGLFDPAKIRFVIIDEAHQNVFNKLLDHFPHANIIGVTATPLSSDINLPLHHTYSELCTGEPISSLITDGYLASPATTRYDVELQNLQQGTGGDFTTSSSDELYSSEEMLALLLHAYRTVARGRKTLIFNNGIFTSRKVCEYFSNAGYPVRHLDNNCTPEERQEIVEWFRNTLNGILTSVSILTTGFDEPTVRNIIIYRATTSLTLYHQMIGRGSRRLASKKRFNIIDLGGNVERFGAWETQIDWQGIFANPDQYLASIYAGINGPAPVIQVEFRSKFPNTSNFSFDMQGACQQAQQQGRKIRLALQESIRQHALMCLENAGTAAEALHLATLLEPEIIKRVRIYSKSLGSVTKNYREWLQEDYCDRLNKLIQKLITRRDFSKAVA